MGFGANILNLINSERHRFELAGVLHLYEDGKTLEEALEEQAARDLAYQASLESPDFLLVGAQTAAELIAQEVAASLGLNSSLPAPPEPEPVLAQPIFDPAPIDLVQSSETATATSSPAIAQPLEGGEAAVPAIFETATASAVNELILEGPIGVPVDVINPILLASNSAESSTGAQITVDGSGVIISPGETLQAALPLAANESTQAGFLGSLNLVDVAVGVAIIGAAIFVSRS